MDGSKLKFWIKKWFMCTLFKQSIQFTKIIAAFCEMKETSHDPCVEKDYLAWFYFIKDEDKALCQPDNTALWF